MRFGQCAPRYRPIGQMCVTAISATVPTFAWGRWMNANLRNFVLWVIIVLLLFALWYYRTSASVR